MPGKDKGDHEGRRSSTQRVTEGTKKEEVYVLPKISVRNFGEVRIQ